MVDNLSVVHLSSLDDGRSVIQVTTFSRSFQGITLLKIRIKQGLKHILLRCNRSLDLARVAKNLTPLAHHAVRQIYDQLLHSKQQRQLSDQRNTDQHERYSFITPQNLNAS